MFSAYFPNGREVGTEAYAYKLDWMARLAGHLEREYSPWARAFAQLVRASIAAARGQRSEAIVRLRSIASTRTSLFLP